MLLRTTVFGALLALPVFATSIQTFTDSSAWGAAAQANALAAGVAPSDYQVVTESFANNKINTPGLSIQTCSWNLCGDYTAGNGLGEIVNNEWLDSVGKFASLNGRIGYYDTTSFTFANSLYGLGFDFSMTDAFYGGFSVLISSGDSVEWVFPFGYFTNNLGNWETSPYTGFLGFTSAKPITGIEFLTGSMQFSISNMQFGDPTDPNAATPEPATLALSAFGLLTFGLAKTRAMRRALHI
jgi:PEP-CTERM motif